jgi:hypothetical protein
MLAADPADDPPHPRWQREAIVSNSISINRPEEYGTVRAYLDLGAHLRFMQRIALRFSFHYYPWTCPESGAVGWTIEPAGNCGHEFFPSPSCDPTNWTGWGLPSLDEIDSLKVYLEVADLCGDFDDCDLPPENNATPYFDELRVGLFPEVVVPVESDAAQRAVLRTELSSVAPNPFNPAVEIRYTVAETGRVTIAVLDVAARVVATLVDADREAGAYALA